MKCHYSGLALHLIVQFDVEIFAPRVVNRGRAAIGVASEINKENILRTGEVIERGPAAAAEHDHRNLQPGLGASHRRNPRPSSKECARQFYPG